MKRFHDDAEAVARRHARQVFVAAATALAVLFMGSNLPSALYGVFRAAFGYSSLTQTLLYAAAVAVIVGHGLIFVGEMTEITIATPAEERGAVISVVHLINYIGLGGPAIGVGFLSLSYGLLAATRFAALVIVVLCVLLIPLVRSDGIRRAATAK